LKNQLPQAAKVSSHSLIWKLRKHWASLCYSRPYWLTFLSFAF